MNFKTPVELAKAACGVGTNKAAWSVNQMLVLGFLAGAYIGFAGWLFTIVTHDMVKAGYSLGITRFVGGSVFSVGLMLVVIAGAELFTGNCLMPLGVMAGCVTPYGMLRNWFWVYMANLIGSIAIAYLIYATGLWKMSENALGAYALKVASAKMALPFGEALARGIACNWLVVLAVWMSMAATDIVGKIWAIYFPIMAFVASNFEHSIANMYFMTIGMLVKGQPAVVEAAGLAQDKLDVVSISGFINNLIPVTIGNIIGGVLFVAIFYYLVFQSKLKEV